MCGTSLSEALTKTVGRGGDTDTNAAICGALLSALQGRDAVPLQWRNAILSCRPVKARGVHHPRPREYWPDDAMELAEALLGAKGSRRRTARARAATSERKQASDKRPTDQHQFLLQAKLDGYLEAAVLAVRVQNVALIDALALATRALLREFSAHAVPREDLVEIWAKALKTIYPDGLDRPSRWVH